MSKKLTTRRKKTNNARKNEQRDEKTKTRKTLVLCSFVFPCCSFFSVFFVLSLSFVFCGVIRFLWWCPFFRGVVHFSVLSTVRCCSCFPRCSFSFVVLFDFSVSFVFLCCRFFRVVRFSVMSIFSVQ